MEAGQKAAGKSAEGDPAPGRPSRRFVRSSIPREALREMEKRGKKEEKTSGPKRKERAPTRPKEKKPSARSQKKPASTGKPSRNMIVVDALVFIILVLASALLAGMFLRDDDGGGGDGGALDGEAGESLEEFTGTILGTTEYTDGDGVTYVYYLRSVASLLVEDARIRGEGDATTHSLSTGMEFDLNQILEDIVPEKYDYRLTVSDVDSELFGIGASDDEVRPGGSAAMAIPHHDGGSLMVELKLWRSGS